MKFTSFTLTATMFLLASFMSINNWGYSAYAQVSSVKPVKGASSDVKEAQSFFVNSKKSTSSKPMRLPVYKPPKGIGAPGGRVGGGTRGDSALAMLFALVPDHLGLTITEQPSLYWYLSKEVSHEMVLTVNHEKLVKPVLELTLASKGTPGIHSVSLKDHNIKLELETEYQWFVELVLDSDYPARNLVAGGRIMRITPPDSLLVKLREAESQEKTSVYSEAGLWYDAFDSISDLIDRRPDNPQYANGRKYLLEQVYTEEIDNMMEFMKEEESVSLMDDPSMLFMETGDESYVPTFVGHQ